MAASRPGNPAARAVAHSRDDVLKRGERIRSDKSLGALVGNLVSDGKAWLMAEFAVIRAQAKESASKVQTALVLFVVGALLALAGIIVFAHTLVLALAPFLGPAWAGLAISVSLLVIAAGLFLYGRSLLGQTTLIPERLDPTKTVAEDK